LGKRKNGLSMNGRRCHRYSTGLSGKLLVKQILKLVFLGVIGIANGPIAQAKEQIISTAPVLPREKPNVPPFSAVVDNADYIAIEAAYRALDKRQWRLARDIAQGVEDQTAADLINWQILTTKSADATFDEILSFAEKRSTWPRLERLLSRAEEVIPKDMPPLQIIAWFAGQEPMTGEGKLRLGEAFLATGQPEYGKFWIERAWVEHNFQIKREKHILKTHKKLLSKEIHEKRMTRLLWHRQHSAAKRLSSHVGRDIAALANARITLASGPGNPKKVISTVPKALRSDPGLLYDQVYGLRRRGRDEQTWPLLIDGPTDIDLMVRPDKWWTERHLQARKAHKDKDYDSAYKLAANNGLERGGDFAEAEFLAGWIALRYLDKPDVAFKHFENLEQGVSYPISLARAAYWKGRAAEAMGDTDLARREFISASGKPYTYYGQLALDHPLIAAETLILPSTMPVRDHLRWAFDAQDDVKAVKLLDEFGRKNTLRTFIYHVADNYNRPEDFALLADLTNDMHYINLSIRIAKKANQHHIALVEHSYPIREVPVYTGKGKAPDVALVFGLSRQESEFNSRAISSAGARGLMQLMPTTARITARKHHLEYDRDWLLDDPTYNQLVGMAHLSDLIKRFDGSYIMTIASYNAGALRIDRWNKDYGDPRKGEIDPIDWVESIPFKETRNYVQRVLENTQVYRGRLAGTSQPNEITSDLHRKTTTDSAMLERSNPAQLASVTD
jgi:soluble lytic murein transglycosylase